MDKKDSQFHLHTPDYQLSGNNIRDLAETPSGNLLIGTGHGLSMLDKRTGKIINFNSKTGFPLTLVNRNSLQVSRDENIYIGGTTGMIAIRENNL